MNKIGLGVCILFWAMGWSCNGQIGSLIGPEKTPRSVAAPQGAITVATEKLSFYLTRNTTSDAEKAFEIYKWITQNISYDHELMRNATLQKQIYTSEENVIKKVLERKMALCGGYAFLFKKMCADVGIVSEVVHGYTRKYSAKTPKRATPEHTWNVVKLNGEWHLLDITWAISHGSENKPDNFWYLVNPSEFILSHYPENKKWTLLKDPVSQNSFLKNP